MSDAPPTVAGSFTHANHAVLLPLLVCYLGLGYEYKAAFDMAVETANKYMADLVKVSRE